MAKLGICRDFIHNSSRTICRSNNGLFSHRLKTTSAPAAASKMAFGVGNGSNETTVLEGKVTVGDSERATPAEDGTMSSGLDLAFCDSREAYKSKTTIEVARALLVFKLCQFDSLVTYNREV